MMIVQSDYLKPNFRSIASFYERDHGQQHSTNFARCSWPIKPTLVVCGQCEKPDYSVIECYNPMNSLQLEDAGCDRGSRLDVCQQDVFCNYSLPSGANVTM